jgi:cytidine deaminase
LSVRKPSRLEIPSGRCRQVISDRNAKTDNITPQRTSDEGGTSVLEE